MSRLERFRQRLGATREIMHQRGYDALIVPRADEYLGEYIPLHNERLQWISGFGGSAGLVVILADSAAIFVDGRYTVQVRQQVPAELFEYHHLVDEPLPQWLLENLPSDAAVACDPRLHPLHWYRETESLLSAGGLQLTPDSNNIIDVCWQDRPDPLVRPALLLAERYTGESSTAKRQRIAQDIKRQGADAALIFAPDSVSWLLNIRGQDVPLLPIVQSMAILTSEGELTLVVDPRRIPDGFAEHVGSGVTLVPEEQAEQCLARYEGKVMLADPHSANAWVQLTLESAGVRLIMTQDVVLLPKAGKNSVEIAGAQAAHRRDAVAEIGFLRWLDEEVAAGKLHDEAVLSDKLLSFRARGEHFHGGSFDTISAAGPNAAMCHYNHLNADPAQLTMNSVYLLDSGGQYTDGTTDITRTIAIGDPGDDIRRMYTLVLKGHIALGQARFPAGTTGTQLDILARQFLWASGYDYDHGTGHGVGAFLSVHEGPQRIGKKHNGVALQPGMILSNEPGYYRDGAYGIRCENLVVIRQSKMEGFETPMMEFEALTLVPFDNRLLLADLLTDAEIAWLNTYHANVLDTIGPLLEESDRQWLRRATGSIATA